MAERSRARRQRTLLDLATRHGEVKLEIHAGADEAAEALDLLDELNSRGLLRYGGCKASSGSSIFTYLTV